MRKIGILLPNRGVADVCFSGIKDGNPGVGGSVYHLALLYVLLKERLEVECFTFLPQKGLESIVLDSERIEEFILSCNKHSIGTLIFWPKADSWHKEMVEMIDGYDISLVAWNHNMMNAYIHSYLAGSRRLLSNVVVSRQQKIRLIGSKLYKKTDVIYNSYTETVLGSESKEDTSHFNVVFIGSLVPAKGFHVLARAWRLILRQTPNARLHVIGSGSLYSRDTKLGPYGLAEKAYETKILRPLLTNDGKILDSVIFHGSLGAEKWEIIKRATVGVVNPTSKSENCPGSALDFQTLNIPVVSKRSNGLVDTVNHKETGYLYRFEFNLPWAIEKARKMRVENKGSEFVKRNYNRNSIVSLWCEVLTEKKRLPWKIAFSDLGVNFNLLKIFYALIFRRNLIIDLYRIK